MKHLRANSDFREVARYPGFGGDFSPNQLIFGGPQSGQANFVNMQPTMPTGVVFEGVRFFESTNLPTVTVNLNYTYASGVTAPTAHPAGAADRTGYLGIFFGPQAVGSAIGGPNAEVLLNNNDDFARFVIAIWRLYAGFELLNPDFVTVARTYAD